MRPLICLALALSFGLSVAPVAESQEYRIQLDRPSAVGQTYRVSVVAHEEQTNAVTLNGRELQREDKKFTVHFDAKITVLALSDNEQPVKESAVVERLDKIEGKKTTELVDKGTVIVASIKDDKKQFTVDGRPVEAELAEVLEVAYSLGTGKTDDEVFGTAEPQAVGDSWPMNAEAAADDPELRELQIDKKNIHGKVTLQSVRRVGQVECLQILAKATIDNVMPPMPEGADMKANRAVAQMRMTGLFPTDPTMDRLRESLEMTMEMQLQGRPAPGAPEMVIDSRFKRSATVKYTY
ncbi:MAG: hypothetical protein HQ581_06155 [Planctomycetes bacterium]|nr:hypothetical protein [Planctomycetota bacterium]